MFSVLLLVVVLTHNFYVVRHSGTPADEIRQDFGQVGSRSTMMLTRVHQRGGSVQC